MKILFSVLLFLIISACQSNEVLNSTGQVVGSQALFPDGVYNQLVQVKVVDPKAGLGQFQEFEFQALMKKNGKDLAIFGYNAFGISMLTIKSADDSHADLTSSIGEIQKHKDFFLKFFPYVRRIIYFSATEFNQQRLALEKTFAGKVEIKFEQDSTIPRSIVLDGDGKYQVVITNQKFTEAVASSNLDTARH